MTRRTPKSPRAMLEAIIRNLPTRTGRSLDEWVRLVKTKGPVEKKQRIAWLRSVHGLGGPTATVIASEADGEDLLAPYDDQEALLEAMYAGAKSGLRPIHDTVLKAVIKLGPDVTVSARKTYVSASRHRQFAAIQPSTRTRVDLGLALPGVKASGQLLESKNVGGGRVTHRIALSSKSDFNADAKKWLEAAYAADDAS